MKILAVDLGDKRTGIAISDASLTLAGEAFTIEEWDKTRLAEKIAELAREKDIFKIVLGNPKNMNNSEGERSQKSADFAQLLRTKTQIPVILWDERTTTVSALRILSDAGKKRDKQRQRVDAVAATIILQGYLDYLHLHPDEQTQK